MTDETQEARRQPTFRVRGDLGDVGRNAREAWEMPEEGDEAFIKTSFREFLVSFSHEGQAKYLHKLRDLLASAYGDTVTLAVDLADLQAFEVRLFDYVRVFPADSLVFMDEVATDIARSERPQEEVVVRVSVFNHPFV